jgi:hypothetical protein
MRRELVMLVLCPFLAVCGPGQCTQENPSITFFISFKGQTSLLTCAEAHVVTVKFTFDEEGSSDPYHLEKDLLCQASDHGYYFEIPPGHYSVRVEGLDTRGIPCFTIWRTNVDHATNPALEIALPISYTLDSTGKCTGPYDAGPPDGKREGIGKPDAPRPDAPRPDAPRPDAPRPDLRGSETGVGCVAPGAGMQTFGGGMYGCAGAVSWSGRATLCASGSHVCSGAEWVANRGTTAPSYNYWTDDNFNFGGGVTAGCYATLTGGSPCTTGGPVHVCADATDPKGNTCSAFGCGYLTAFPNQYFGGCNALTAGTLCCK